LFCKQGTNVLLHKAAAAAAAAAATQHAAKADTLGQEAFIDTASWY
jgi:hypothetical protein